MRAIHRLLIVPAWLMLVLYGHAWAIHVYHFSGSGDVLLFGAFKLDESADWQLEPGPQFTSAVLRSPIQRIEGVYGDYAFAGTVELHVLDQVPYVPGGYDSNHPDHWIVRGRVESQEIDGRSVEAINLFIYTAQGATTVTLDPPLLGVPTDYNLQYTILYGDGSFDGRSLASLQRVPTAVPVPSALTLILSSLLAVVLIQPLWRFWQAWDGAPGWGGCSEW